MNEKYNNYTWEEFNNLSLEEKVPLFNRGFKPFHCLIAQQFNREFLDHLYHITNVIRAISKSKNGSLFLQSILPTHRAMLYFMQPSTRTYLSFKTACQILGIQTSDVRDSSISSEVKGETSEDTIRTFSSYFDFIIMRHPEEGMAEQSAWVLEHSERTGSCFKMQDQVKISTQLRHYSTSTHLEGRLKILVGSMAKPSFWLETSLEVEQLEAWLKCWLFLKMSK